VLWHDASCRVIRVDDPDYPGYCRLIWNEHVAEMSDLSPPNSATASTS
jgi:diadenosine tetraphosphate (Ap4A) HIT family hydrolase